MKYIEDNNDLIFSIENGDSFLVRRLIEAKCRALFAEINALEECEKTK